MRKNPLAWLVVAGLVIMGLCLGNVFRVERRLFKLKKETAGLVSKHQAAIGAVPGNWEAEFQKAGQKAGGGKFIGFRLLDNGAVPELSVEWEGSAPVLIKMLSEVENSGVGAPAKLEIRKIAGDGQMVRLSASFTPGSQKTPASNPPSLKRNVFQSLWAESQGNDAVVSRINPREEKRRKEEEARLQREQKEREEQDRANARRLEVQNGFVLTGIANNGKESLAFVQSRAGEATRTLRQGDSLNDARVTLIDSIHGELRLEFAGLSPIILRLQQ